MAIEEHWFNVAVEAGIPFEDWEEEEDWGNEAQEAQSDRPSLGGYFGFHKLFDLFDYVWHMYWSNVLFI